MLARNRSDRLALSASRPAEDESIADGAWRSWSTPPPKSRESVREQRLLDAAARFTIRFQGRLLSAYAWGSGRTVLLVHGWGGRASQFGSFVGTLVDAGLRPIAVDAPGHGRSNGVESSLFEFADIVNFLARDQPIHAVIAHSMGAASTTIALGKGASVNGVVLLCPILRLRDALARFALRANLDDAIERELVARMEETFGHAVWDDSALDKIAPDLVTPALLIHDLRDAEIPYEDSVRTARAWRASRLVTTSGLGHRSLLRDPRVISEAMSFITSL